MCVKKIKIKIKNRNLFNRSKAKLILNFLKLAL